MSGSLLIQALDFFPLCFLDPPMNRVQASEKKMESGCRSESQLTQSAPCSPPQFPVPDPALQCFHIRTHPHTPHNHQPHTTKATSQNTNTAAQTQITMAQPHF